MADIEVDKRYGNMRDRHGIDHASANGYVGHWFFHREQRFLLDRIDSGLVLDVACGSALMLKNQHHLETVGLDFNETACAQAFTNGQTIVRGDAFNMPFPDDLFDNVINCQFLNQQTADNRLAFLRESNRVLRPGGHCHIMWRGAETLIHRSVNFLSNLARKIQDEPVFPQYHHPPIELIEEAKAMGLKLVERNMTLPLGSPSVTPDTWAAKLFGASHYVKLEKRP